MVPKSAEEKGHTRFYYFINQGYRDMVFATLNKMYKFVSLVLSLVTMGSKNLASWSAFVKASPMSTEISRGFKVNLNWLLTSFDRAPHTRYACALLCRRFELWWLYVTHVPYSSY